MSDEPAHPLVRLSGWVRLGLLKELSGPARDVLMVLATYASKERAQAFPAASTIIGLTGRSRSVVFASLKELQAGEVIAMRGRVKRRGSEAWGPTIYGIANPPPSPEKFDVLVRRLRTYRFPGGVPYRRTSRFTRDATGRFRCPSPRDGGSPVATDGGRPSATDKDRDVSEGENLKGRHEGEGGVQGREPKTGAPPPDPRVCFVPGENQEGEASKGGEPDWEQHFAVEAIREQKVLAGIRSAIEAASPVHRERIGQHLILRGYPAGIVVAELARANGGAAR